MTVEKPTVVDEFFSALFSHPKSDKNSSQANKKRSLDEYDEYAMLTKRKLDGSSRPMIRLKKSKDTQEDIYLGSKMRMRNVSTAMHWKDIRDRFSKFGKIIDIVFKHPFVFVQFETVEACTSAVENEQGKPWRGSTLELEVCRYRPCFSAEPQKPKAPKLDNSKITKLLVRSHVTRSFVSVLSSDFEKSGVLLDTVYVKNPKSERELIKTFVKNGIKTVVTIDRNLEQNERVSLRLFSSEDNGKSASFDQYDSILSKEAIELIVQFAHQTPLESAQAFKKTSVDPASNRTRPLPSAPPCEKAPVNKAPQPVIRKTPSLMASKSAGPTANCVGQPKRSYTKPPSIHTTHAYVSGTQTTHSQPRYGQGMATASTSSYLTVPTAQYSSPNVCAQPTSPSPSVMADPRRMDDVVSLLSAPQHQLAVSRLLSTILNGLRTPASASSSSPSHLSPLPNTPALVQNAAHVRPW